MNPWWDFLSATGLTGPSARRIAAQVAGAVVICNPVDTGPMGKDRAATDRALRGFVAHPNVGAVLIVGGNQPKVTALAEHAAASGRRVEALSLDECGHDALTLTDRGVRAAAGMARQLSRDRRRPVPVAELLLGLECGRSDPSSGLVANPLLGLIADRLVDAGGSAMIGETTEWLGAEHLLAARAASPAVAEAIREAALGRERMATAAGIDLLGNNPGPTNIAAGLSSIEEKSLGAYSKSGSAEVSGLLKPGDIVEGRIIGLNRGGLEVKLKGVTAFMPASQVDVMHVKDISIFLGESVRCEVVEIDRRGKNLTVSRRKVLEKERKAKREEVVKDLEVGQVRKGVVGNLTEFGAFVDLGGVDGLIHISEMSHRQIKKPSEVVNPGDVVEVKVLKIQGTGDKQRISLGLKQTQPDPWVGVAERFPVDSNHKVRVVRLADFGAFAELEEGIDGLIPVSEMAWNRIGSPKEVVEVGQLVDVSVLKVEPNRKRISLSMKKAQPDPWAGVIESYTPDTEVTGTVTRLADFGAFIEIAPGVEGMAHISELSEKRIKSCNEVLKVGQEVKARVLRIDDKTRRIGLSLKPAEAASAPLSLDSGKSGPPKKKNKKLRGGLSGGWDWAGTGFEDLGS